jgi:hypothetical protein
VQRVLQCVAKERCVDLEAWETAIRTAALAGGAKALERLP